MRFEDTVLHSPDAGVARAAAALRELERRVVAAGGEVRWHTPVRAIEPDSDGVDVVTDAGTHRADVAIVTVGAWTEKLLGGAGLGLPPLRVTEETPAHFTPRMPTTPTEAFVLERVGPVVVGAGFSGQGFKFAPGVGATLADLVLDIDASAAEPFRLPRG